MIDKVFPNAPWVAKVLPVDAREALITASLIDDDVMRKREVDHAAQQARMKYPQLFQPE